MDNKVKFLRGTAIEYEASTKDNDTFYYTTDTKKLYLGGTEITGGGVTIDDTLSDTSKNPVQNKVINAALNSKADLSDIPSSLPANGGNADTAKSVESETGKAKLHENNEGGQLLLTSPDGTKLAGIDMYANDWLRMFFIDNGVIDNAPFNYNFNTRLFNIRGDITNADKLDGKHADDFCKIYNHIDDSYDVNNATEPGLYRVRGGINVPTANWYDIHVTNLGGYTTQIAISDINSMFKRNFTSVWSEWTEFAYKNDIPTSLPANGGNANTANTAGTLATTPTNACLRNISAGTSDLSAGVSELATGAIYLVYE